MTASLSFPTPPASSLFLVRAPSAANDGTSTAVAEEELAFFFTTRSDGCTQSDDDEDDDWSVDDEADIQARHVIGHWIGTLSRRDQDVLALYFERRPWPLSIKREEVACTGGYALLLLLASPYRHPPRDPACLQEVGVQLEAAVEKHGTGVLSHLARQAERSFATAVRAYAEASGRAPTVRSPECAAQLEAS